MNDLSFSSRLVDAIGWTLLHSLWQGAVLGLLAGGILATLRTRAARWRYTVAVVALGAMPAAALVTLADAWNASRPYSRSGESGVVSHSVSNPAGSRPQGDAPANPRGRFHPVDRWVPNESSSPQASSSRTWVVDRAATREAGPALPAAIAPWLSWVVTGWFVGAVLSAARLIGGCWRVRGLRTRGVSLAPPASQAIFERLIAAMHLRRKVTFLQSSLAATPMVIGYLRPVILAPVGVLAGLSAAELEAILAHELMHIRRHDALVNAIQVVLETLGFYHPVVWWLSRRIREERENCCDDAAMELLGSRSGYGRALLALEELRSPRLPMSLTAAGGPPFTLAATGGHLLSRIRRIAGAEPGKRSLQGAAPAGLLVAFALLAGSAWWISMGQAQPIPPATEGATAQDSAPPPAEDDLVVAGILREVRSDSPIAAAEITFRLPHAPPASSVPVDSKPDRGRAEYRPLGSSPWLNDHEPIWSQTFRSDADGRFEIRIPKRAVDEFQTEWTRQDRLQKDFVPHVIGVTARCPGYLPTRPGTFISIQKKPGPGTTYTCQLTMKKSVEVRGRFVTPDGQPAANLPVMVARNRDGFGDSTGKGFWTRTDADGRFTLETTDDWPQRLHWFPEEHASDSRATTRTFGDQGTVVLKRGTRLRGLIQDDQGNPLAGVAIKATTGTRVPHLYARSDELGCFSFRPLPAGEYALQAVDHFVDTTTGASFRGTLSHTFTPLSYSLTAAGGAPAVIRPSAVREVRFRVIDADENPLEDRTIHAVIAGNHVQSRPVAGEPGRYVLPTPDWDGECEFQIGSDQTKEAVLYGPSPDAPRMPGWSIARRNSSGTDPEITIQVLEGAKLTVTVQTGDGSPLPGNVSCAIHYVGEDRFRTRGVSSGPFGSTTLNPQHPSVTRWGLAAGEPVQFDVWSPGFTSHSQTVNLRPGEVKRVDVVLEPRTTTTPSPAGPTGERPTSPGD